MPAEERVRLDQEGAPVQARQVAGQGGQQHTITRLPAERLRLALEDAELMTQDDQLGAVAVVIVTGQDKVEQEANAGVEGSQKHR